MQRGSEEVASCRLDFALSLRSFAQVTSLQTALMVTSRTLVRVLCTGIKAADEATWGSSELQWVRGLCDMDCSELPGNEMGHTLSSQSQSNQWQVKRRCLSQNVEPLCPHVWFAHSSALVGQSRQPHAGSSAHRVRLNLAVALDGIVSARLPGSLCAPVRMAGEILESFKTPLQGFTAVGQTGACTWTLDRRRTAKLIYT
eukprot:6467030-Amphidinium_carterae.2